MKGKSMKINENIIRSFLTTPRSNDVVQIVQYHFNRETGRRRGVIVAQYHIGDDSFRIGHSIVNLSSDRYDRFWGLEIALSRMYLSSWTPANGNLPRTYDNYDRSFLSRVCTDISDIPEKMERTLRSVMVRLGRISHSHQSLLSTDQIS